MKRTNMNDYLSLMNGVELPDRVRESVLHAALQAQETPPTKAGSPESQPQAVAKQRHLLARSLAAASCVLVFVAGIAFASGIAPWPGASPAGSTIVATLPASGNFFTLAAYAAEQGEGELEQSATLEFKNFGTAGGWSCGSFDVETGLSHNDGDSAASVGDDGQVFARVGFALDLTCIGNNIQSITYSIDGERVHFTSENRTYGPFDDTPVDFQQQDNFTIAYDDQATDKQKMRRQLVAYFPVNERGCEIQTTLAEDSEKQQSIHEKANVPDGESVRIERDEHPELLSNHELKALQDELEKIILHRYAEMLSQSPLTMTVTFDDGSTETKSYTIAPVEDFEQRFAEYKDAASGPNLLGIIAPPTLYTLTETEL